MTEENQAPETPEEKARRQFDKAFRRLDSPFQHEAEAALRVARGHLKTLGMTFGDVLDLVGSGSTEELDELNNLLQQYKEANDQYALAQEAMLAENERLNILLRHFHHTETPERSLTPELFEQSLGKLESIIKPVHDLIRPLEDAETLEQNYLAKVEQALADKKGVRPRPGIISTMLVRLLRGLGHEVSHDGIIKLQNTVSAQHSVLKKQSEFIARQSELGASLGSLMKNIDLILAASTPKEIYDELLEQTRDLQINLNELQNESNFLRRSAYENERYRTYNVSLETRLHELSEKYQKLKELYDAGTDPTVQETFQKFREECENIQINNKGKSIDSLDKLRNFFNEQEKLINFLTKELKFSISTKATATTKALKIMRESGQTYGDLRQEMKVLCDKIENHISPASAKRGMISSLYNGVAQLFRDKETVSDIMLSLESLSRNAEAIKQGQGYIKHEVRYLIHDLDYGLREYRTQVSRSLGALNAYFNERAAPYEAPRDFKKRERELAERENKLRNEQAEWQYVYERQKSELQERESSIKEFMSRHADRIRDIEKGLQGNNKSSKPEPYDP